MRSEEVEVERLEGVGVVGWFSKAVEKSNAALLPVSERRTWANGYFKKGCH